MDTDTIDNTCHRLVPDTILTGLIHRVVVILRHTDIPRRRASRYDGRQQSRPQQHSHSSHLRASHCLLFVSPFNMFPPDRFHLRNSACMVAVGLPRMIYCSSVDRDSEPQPRLKAKSTSASNCPCVLHTPRLSMYFSVGSRSPRNRLSACCCVMC